MAIDLFISPEETLRPGKISFSDIPMLAYNRTVSEEKKSYTKEELLGIYHDMMVIREFEEMLIATKIMGEYKGIKHLHGGPIHPSVGNEAVSVGMAYLLGTEDFVFGTHRGHGDILAKGLSAIRKLSGEELERVMSQFRGGITYRVIAENSPEKDVRGQAKDFLVYGAIAEIFAKQTGFNSGMGGSMHAFFPPFGIYPNNAIVAGSAPISTGAALYKKIAGTKGLVVCNIGDGSIGCGQVYEAMNFSAMDQFTTQWPEERKGGLPIIFHVANNQYGMGGQTKGSTMAYEYVSRLGAGVCPDEMHAERVDGTNPLAVIDAFRRKIDLIKRNDGPVLLETVCYRLVGHGTGDPQRYRTKEEVDAWKQYDPCILFRKTLKDAKIAGERELAELEQQVRELIYRCTKWAVDDAISPLVDILNQPDSIAKVMFSNERCGALWEEKPEVLAPKEDNSRLKLLQKKERFYKKDGKPLPPTKYVQMRDVIFEAMMDKFYSDPSVILYGEDVRDWGGAWGVSRAMMESIPIHRMFNSPISEPTITGSAVGYAMCGGRAIIEIMYMDFIARCGDELFNQMAKWQAMSAGLLKMPIVMRVTVGRQYGAQHSQDWASLCAHVPGLKVVYPATPYDAKGLLASAMNGTDPVVFMEGQILYDRGEEFHEGGIPAEFYELPIGEPDVKIKGEDITIITIGASLYSAREAAEKLKAYGISAEIIDVRTLVPLNYEPMIDSVKKTGKVVIVGDEVSRNSFMNTIAQTISELAFDYLDAPPCVVGAQNWICPAPEYDRFFYPDADWILDAIHTRIKPLDGYLCKNNFSKAETMRRNRLGV
ncbi:alpha-ketoacid dehydrogenase subunit alpha/beta [Yanshouia hominis]|uniref:Dehydrogenase n=1 Tax=Yanshouia hominis TaxID=2763673 RepID=A0ABR7NPI7_9FIRM|nr:alpha-ketoacid dehydrogenase subunit alpha/beta [Yanshouia hominis]MBC8577573.1 dehydrogenase [Yanshouia hominis]